MWHLLVTLPCIVHSRARFPFFWHRATTINRLTSSKLLSLYLWRGSTALPRLVGRFANGIIRNVFWQSSLLLCPVFSVFIHHSFIITQMVCDGSYGVFPRTAFRAFVSMVNADFSFFFFFFVQWKCCKLPSANLEIPGDPLVYIYGSIAHWSSD